MPIYTLGIEDLLTSDPSQKEALRYLSFIWRIPLTVKLGIADVERNLVETLLLLDRQDVN